MRFLVNENVTGTVIIAFDLDDSRLQDRLGPIPWTSLHDGMAEAYRRFVELRDQGRLDLSDLA